jgi:hypothetical protein
VTDTDLDTAGLDTLTDELTLLPDYALRATGPGRQQSDAPLFYVDGATEGTTQ